MMRPRTITIFLAFSLVLYPIMFVILVNTIPQSSNAYYWICLPVVDLWAHIGSSGQELLISTYAVYIGLIIISIIKYCKKKTVSSA